MQPHPESLVQELNALLASLSLPLTVTTPYDLTPSLLLAILESVLRARLPISDEIRKSHSQASKVAAMKIFLGVLEDDVLRMDVGLSEVDPRRLAAGEYQDLIFVGEVLCWIARHRGFCATEETVNDSSSSGPSNGNTGASISFSQVDELESSATTISWNAHSNSNDGPPTMLENSDPYAPHCVHEVGLTCYSTKAQSNKFNASTKFGNCSEMAECKSSSEIDLNEELARQEHLHPDSIQPSIRTQGWIDLVEDDYIVFEKPKERSVGKRQLRISLGSFTKPRLWKSECSPSQNIYSPHYTLSLLQERARLLGAMARVGTL